MLFSEIAYMFSENSKCYAMVEDLLILEYVVEKKENKIK